MLENKHSILSETMTLPSNSVLLYPPPPRPTPPHPTPHPFVVAKNTGNIYILSPLGERVVLGYLDDCVPRYVTNKVPLPLFYRLYLHQGESGSCLEATWHGARVAVKRLLPPVKFGSGGGRGGVGGRVGSGGARRVFSAAEASAVRREMRVLQSLRFDFLMPIYGVRMVGRHDRWCAYARVRDGVDFFVVGVVIFRPCAILVCYCCFFYGATI